MIEKIRKIKYSMMKPEERYVYDIFTNLVEYYHNDYKNNRYYKHNDVLLFEFNTKNGNFWCHYNKFWSVLKLEFDLNYEQIQYLVKHMVEEHLICKDITPRDISSHTFYSVEEHLICKDITPDSGVDRLTVQVEEHLICKDITPLRTISVTSSGVEEHLICKDIKPIQYRREKL